LVTVTRAWMSSRSVTASVSPLLLANMRAVDSSYRG
jgi:hypothetical protein